MGAIEPLVIDDYVGIAVDAPGRSDNADVLYERFQAGRRAYDRVGLHASAGEARRGVDHGVLLGAEFVRGSPCLGSERTRRRQLAEASLLLAEAGRTSRHALRKLLGSWVHALLYRRPIMALLSASFGFLGEVTASDRVFVQLPQSVRAELKTLAVLSRSW